MFSLLNQMNPSELCAAELLETVPLLMRVIRANVRNHRGPEMTVPQFWTLAFIGGNKGAALSEVAIHLGLTPPSASKIVDGLVASKLVTREPDEFDRRCVVLALTPAGRKRYDAARSQARDFLAKTLAPLESGALERLLEATQTLKALFSDAQMRQTALEKTPRTREKENQPLGSKPKTSMSAKPLSR
jgi:DNA-binding MarR family transcriptional regulator